MPGLDALGQQPMLPWDPCWTVFKAGWSSWRESLWGHKVKATLGATLRANLKMLNAGMGLVGASPGTKVATGSRGEAPGKGQVCGRLASKLCRAGVPSPPAHRPALTPLHPASTGQEMKGKPDSPGAAPAAAPDSALVQLPWHGRGWADTTAVGSHVTRDAHGDW